jgi:hypothetical protein
MSALGWKPYIADPHSDVRNVPIVLKNSPTEHLDHKAENPIS